MTRHLRLAVVVLVVAVCAAAWGFGSMPGRAAPEPSERAVTQSSQPEPRRESVVSTETGAERLSGPAAPFRALDDPAWGPNYRANTDPSSTLAQQEPSIAVNPTDPLNVVVAAKDEREGTNSKHVYIYTSTDGGVTWLNQRFPYRQPAPGYSSDPVVNFADDGKCYVTSLPYGGGTAGIQIAYSNDRCLTFEGTGQVTTNTGADKEWTWIDNFPSSPYYHRMYVTWRNFGSGPAIVLNYSTDRGMTWSSDSSVATSGYQFSMPVVLPNGNVLVTHLSDSFALAYSRSTNGGVTFAAPYNITPVVSPECPPDNPGCSIWRLNPIPSTGVDPTDGSIVSMWSDGRNGTATIYYTHSTDGGASWAPAAQLAASGVSGTYQVEPWVEADEAGTFHAIWYDNRDNPNTSIFHTLYSRSTDNGATWTQPVRISTAPSDLRIGVPSGYGLAAGDYIQVTASHGNIYAAWTDTRSGTGEDIYVVRGIKSQGTPTPTATPTPTTCAVSFSDVPPTDPFYANIMCLACRGILGGYSDGTFRPYNNITRGQIAKVVSNAAGLSDPVSGQTYADVDAANPFYEWIERLTARGVMSGYPCGGAGEPCDPQNRPYFRWGANATRGQLSKIVSNAAGFAEPVSGPTFADVPPTNPFYAEIERLASRGIMGGYPCGSVGEPCDPQNRPYFRWAANVTRGQASKIVANTFFPGCVVR